MSKINPKPIDLQNGKRLDSWCKYYLFVAYFATWLGSSRQFSPCCLRVFFKTLVLSFASLLLLLFNDLHNIKTNGKIACLECISPTLCYFQVETARKSILCAGSFKGLRIRFPKVPWVACAALTSQETATYAGLWGLKWDSQKQFSSISRRHFSPHFHDND